MSSNEEDTVKNLQAAVRSYIARKKYGIKLLEESQRPSYQPFLIGNDKPLSQSALKPYQIDAHFVLVGTSMFRSIDFACKVAGPGILPKVIIVDNSSEVFHCWQELRRFFTDTKLTDQDDFLEGPEGLLEFIINNLLEAVRGENIYTYFSNFFKLYSFEEVQKIVMGMAIISQSWGHEDTFTQIKNIYFDMPIVAYPSNIVSYIKEEDSQVQVLKCINILQPVLCIYSNLHERLNVPTETHVLPDFTPKKMAAALKLTAKVHEKLRELGDNSDPMHVTI